MSIKWDDKSWQKEFLEMKFHSPADVKLLIEGVKGQIGACRLGVLNQEYKRLKKIQEEQQHQKVTNYLQLLPCSNLLRDNNNN